MRGKKQRFADFNNKFVAVRGKKSEQDGEGAGNWEAIGQQQYLVHPWLNVWGEKRAPNGFLGMRGKRPGGVLKSYILISYFITKIITCNLTALFE